MFAAVPEAAASVLQNDFISGFGEHPFETRVVDLRIAQMVPELVSKFGEPCVSAPLASPSIQGSHFEASRIFSTTFAFEIS